MKVDVVVTVFPLEFVVVYVVVLTARCVEITVDGGPETVVVLPIVMG